MKLQKKYSAKKHSHQIIVGIPSKLAVALDIKLGDLVYWSVIDKNNLRLNRTRSQHNDERYFKIFKQHKIPRLYVTLPMPLYRALSWFSKQQFEWKVVHGSLVLRKGLTASAYYKRQNLGE